MTSKHERMQLMAASVIDGTLTAAEQHELQAHLAGCAECRAFHAALRRDNARLIDMMAPIAMPAELRATVAEAERTSRQRPRQLRQGRIPAMPSLVGVLVATMVITLMVGAGLWLASRQPTSRGPAAVASATPFRTTIGPSASPSGNEAGRTPPLGGAPLLVYGLNEGKEHTTLSLIDVGTGERTTLGDLPFRSILEHTSLQWSADRARLFIGRFAGRFQVEQLDNPTDAGADLRLVCCLPEGPYRDWTLSPDGDLVAGLLIDERDTTVTGIAIEPSGGGTGRSLQVPPGATMFQNFAWAPDGSALAIAGCGPCEGERPTGPPSVNRGKLFVVPVDGSPIREIVDLAHGTLGSPAWSPDGLQIAVNMSRCPSDDVAPDCAGRTTVVASVAVSSGVLTDVSESSDELGRSSWSPDGTSLAYFDGAQLFVAGAEGETRTEIAAASDRPTTQPVWSPDGRWLLYATQTDEYDVFQLWIVSVEGGEPRLLGTARGWTW